MCLSEVSSPTICVTGANGFLGAHIVSCCLEKGYRVHATVRDRSNPSKTKHLEQMKGALERLTLFEAEMRSENSTGFEEAIFGCMAVIHAAAPGTDEDLTNEDVHDAVFGTLAVLRASEAAGVKTVVMTSSMCATTSGASRTLQSDWADPKKQLQDGNMYDASKTLSEWAAWEFMKKESAHFKLVAILPACIVGSSMAGTSQCGLRACPDDSSDLVDVKECAAQHVAALKSEVASGRYCSTARDSKCLESPMTNCRVTLNAIFNFKAFSLRA